MRFQLTIASSHTPDGWVEDYDRDELLSETDVSAWARDLVQSFNDTLRPGELPRRLVHIEIVGPSAPRTQHDTRVDRLTDILRETIDSLKELVSESALHNIVNAILDGD